MKKLILFVIILLLLFLSLAVMKDSIAKIALEKAIKAATDLNVATASVNISLLENVIRVAGIRIYNPAGFEDAVMALIPLLYIDFDIKKYLAEKKAHFEVLKLDLQEFLVIKNTEGRLNVNSISGVSSAGQKEEVSMPLSRRQKAVQIDILELKVEKVIYKDYTQFPVLVREFNVNLNERYENITDIERLVRLIVTRAIINTTISSLANLDIVDYSKIIEKGKDVLEVIKGDVTKGTDISKESLKDAAKELKKIFQLPFEE